MYASQGEPACGSSSMSGASAPSQPSINGALSTVALAAVSLKITVTIDSRMHSSSGGDEKGICAKSMCSRRSEAQLDAQYAFAIQCNFNASWYHN